jgi:hypothetical protein
MAVIVEITQRTVLRPSSGSAWGDGKKVPLTVFDCASTDGYIPTVFAWNAPAPANSALMDGLLDAVARFPHLAGRFAVDDHGRKCIHLNDAGVLVLEATAATDLAEALPHDVPAHISELYPDAENVRTYSLQSMHAKYSSFLAVPMSKMLQIFLNLKISI